LKQISWWFSLGNLANGLWIVVWLNEQMGLSVLLILILLFSLIQLAVRLQIGKQRASLQTIILVWAPVCIYLGWIVVASVANISVFLVSIGWQGGFLQEMGWAIIMILTATGIYLALLKTRNMKLPAVVGIWALVAIAQKQWQLNNEIVYVALAASAILLVSLVIHILKTE
jgi:hypothetical protein